MCLGRRIVSCLKTIRTIPAGSSMQNGTRVSEKERESDRWSGCSVSERSCNFRVIRLHINHLTLFLRLGSSASALAHRVRACEYIHTTFIGGLSIQTFLNKTQRPALKSTRRLKHLRFTPFVFFFHAPVRIKTIQWMKPPVGAH